MANGKWYWLSHSYGCLALVRPNGEWALDIYESHGGGDVPDEQTAQFIIDALNAAEVAKRDS